jgi:hypothetical protein
MVTEPHNFIKWNTAFDSRKWTTSFLDLSRIWRIFVELWVVGLCWATIQAAAVQAQLDRQTVDAGGSAVLRILIQPSSQSAAAPPQIPEIADCEVRYSGMGTQVSYINGVRSDSVIHNYTVHPEKEGVVTIPSIPIEVEGRMLRTQPLRLQVTRGITAEDFGYLELLAPTNTLYVGQTFQARLRLLFRASPRQVDLPSLPTDGFVVGRRPKLVSAQERVGNEVYGVVTSDVALTPARSGELTLGPAEWGALFPVGGRNARRSVFDDPFFQRFFGEERPFTFQSPIHTLKVLDPPTQGRPPGFQGAIGKFQMSASPLGSTTVKLGDPVTVRVRVDGIGSMERLRLPSLPPTDVFNVYSGTNRFDPGDLLGLSGTKTFELIYVPRQTNVIELPVPKLVYFDPDTKTYGTTSVRPIQIQVLPHPEGQVVLDSLAGMPSATAPDSEGSLRQPTTPKEGPPEFLKQVRPWALRAGYPILLGLPFGLLALTWIGRRIRSWTAPDVQEQQRRQAEERLAIALENLKLAVEHRQSPEFCGWLREVLQEQIALFLGASPGSFTADCIDKQLVPAGLDFDVVLNLQHLFHLVDRARYGALQSDLDFVAEYERVEQVVQAMSKVNSTRGKRA